MNTAADEPNISKKARRSLGTAVTIGTAIAWYDFLVYGVVGALVFNQIFFPNLSESTGRTAVFAAIAVSFLARPFGAILFGWIGDTVGRRSALLLSITLAGLSSTAIGLLPSYDTIGILAPILLIGLRALSGAALAGEWAGAIVLSTESAPAERRGFYGALPQFGAPLGILGAVFAVAFFILVPLPTIYAWGWRVPFLLSLPLTGIALYIRLRVAESPAFDRSAHSASSHASADVQALPRLVVGIAACWFASGLGYLLTVFVIHYGTESLEVPAALYLAGAGLAAVLLLIGIAIGARLTRYMPAWGVVALGMILSSGTCAFMLIPLAFATPLWAVLLIGVEIGSLGLGYAALGTMLCETMPAHRRYRGVALSFSLAAVLGGLLPFWIAAESGADELAAMVGLTLLVMVMTFVSAVAALILGTIRIGPFNTTTATK